MSQLRDKNPYCFLETNIIAYFIAYFSHQSLKGNENFLQGPGFNWKN